MDLFNLLSIAVGLSMDAFAVSVCKGLAMQADTESSDTISHTGMVTEQTQVDGQMQATKQKIPGLGKACVIVGLWFGAFQALMPALGYLLGSQFERYITSVDHWIAFILLGLIGISMIREALSGKEDHTNSSLDCKTMLVLAIATSIDALAVGITFAFLRVEIVSSVLIIGVTTFLLSAVGVKVGSVFGIRYKSRAELAGGIILILIGLKILLEHLGILG